MDLLKSFRDNCGFGLLANIKNRATHKNLEDAITALERMMHRGAVAADGKSGDGSGLLLSMPDKFMKKVALAEGVTLPQSYAVGVIFTKDISHLDIVEEYCDNNDLKVLLKRDVPMDTNALGKQALETLPNIVQVFITPNSIMASKRFEALLYLTRKEIEHRLKDDKDFYIPTFSNKIIAYKGLVMPTHIKEFYTDLADDDFEISFCLFHQRFSTNTLPQWKLAQPFRSVAHNGEINSVEANRFNVNVKCEELESSVFTKDELARITPILQEGSSDSASADNFFEFLIANDVDFFKAARAVIPAPWQNAPHMDSKLRAFYEYSSTCFEAWDGPAAFSLTDGRYIGCVLDRNGLRPSKYTITTDDTLLISSEFGVNDIDEEQIIDRGRLQSGEMIALDLKYGKVLKNSEINEYLKDSQAYSTWLNDHMEYLQEYIDNSFTDITEYQPKDLEKKQRAFNITLESIEQIIEPMAKDGKEPVGSMGDDTPIAAFSDQQRNFTDFFKQKFAQVTNPPIDPYREKIVMSLNTGFGPVHNILEESAENATRLKAISPILMKEKLDVLLSFGDENSPRYKDCYKHRVFSTLYENDLEKTLNTLIIKIIESVRDNGSRIVVLDDRAIDKDHKPMPMAMVVGKLNQELLKAKLKRYVSVIAITGEVYEPHSASVLLSYGVTALYPYMLYSTVVDINKNKELSKSALAEKLKNTQKALNAGILKIMSKMGISTVASYRNSGLHDVIGLSKKIANECFSSSHALIEGLCYSDIEARINKWHKKAFVVEHRIFPIQVGGFYKYIENHEHHDYKPATVYAIHKSSITAKADDYAILKELVNNRDKKMIRDFLEFNSDKESISIDKVESKDEIFKRFAAAAMSCGSISPEAHEAIAEAMNTIGGMSNSGEGGEDPARFGTIKNSKIKQVASGRFGVTPGYLASATEIQIKVAQGAKPGEGGQLPGHKVTPLIASLRYTIPGVTLISPPPHHDIYSIEDLAQLIYDLKQVNPRAKITVKLVSTAGVGTIAAGVAKAYADRIIISGGDGGTGAAPLSSIKFAGNPFEIGLAEAHNALKVNHLREFVHVQADGGLKTGMDVVKATMLGAESYGFGTGVLVVLGCKILRVCHLNRCTVGVATQDETLRGHFVGTVDRLVNYFTLLAEDIREILASLGYTSLQEIVGRTDLLKVIDDEFAKKFNFDSLLMKLDGIDTCQKESNEPFDPNDFEKAVLKDVYEAIEKPGTDVVVKKDICNLNRSFGARISGEIARYYGDKGLKDDSIKIKLNGVAGQSLGAFLSKGVSIYLKGYGNDYVCKGMSGGKVIITPELQGSEYSAIGNTCLYGATGGKLFVAGSAGERFAVRNSGAISIVEGTGDHACEYMTGGVVAILGETGINFGAGMTGGVAFVYDKKKIFADKMNRELIEIIRIDTDDSDRERHYLKKLLKQYLSATGSQKAEFILENFRDEIRYFWMVKPKDMNKVPLNPDEGD
jgi:glutamate synthase (NADPH/NADH) large chain